MRTIGHKSPTRAEQHTAQHAMEQLESISAKKPRQIFLSFQVDKQNFSLEIPELAMEQLTVILHSIAAGKVVQFAEQEDELSTQQVADLLQVSRPYVVKLLEEGQMPYKLVGTHRRIALKDVQTYEKKQQAVRSKQLDFLTRQAQDLQLGYE